MFIFNAYKKTKHFIVTLRFSILTIFITFFVISMVSLIAITYLRFSSTISYTAFKLMDEVSLNIHTNTQKEFLHSQLESQMIIQSIKEGLVNINDRKKLEQFLYNQMKFDIVQKHLSVQSFFWWNEANHTMTYAGIAPDNKISVQFLNEENNQLVHTTKIYDMNGNLLSSWTNLTPKTSFIAHTRPWFLAATTMKKMTVTDVYQYVYFHIPSLGVAVATPVYSKGGELLGILSVDLRIDQITRYIEESKASENSIAFIVADDGRLIAYPNLIQYNKPKLKQINDISNQWIIKSFQLFQQNKKFQFDFKFKGQNYLAAYNPLSKFGDHMWYLGLVLPENDFIGDLVSTNYIMLAVSFLILLVSIALVSHLVSRTINPLKQVEAETQKIKDFDLSGDVNIKSRIKEIINLTTALQAMKKGLRLFQKYVPAMLVRKLIETGKEGEIEGEKKQLAIFFSDIKDFTTIAEHMDTKALMEQTCEYFEHLTKIISEEAGTIDKYIGDSIMAFWGAPIEISSPVHHAARAAIRCQQRLKQLNQAWQTQGKNVFITRIGIHYGEAIVGNLGSSERLSYTAIGDAINITSRLESINKVYGTHIIVTNDVYEKIKNDFALRMIDYIVLKGKDKSHAIYIYELIAMDVRDIDYDIHLYNEAFLLAFNAYKNKLWQEAISLFEKCLMIYPQDKVAPIFMERSVQFKVNPPSANWLGEWYFITK